MDANAVILVMLGVLAAVLAWVVLAKHAKPLGKIILRAAAGCAAIAVFNVFLSFAGIHVGVNLITASVVGLFGIPGYIALVCASFLL